MCLLGLVGVLGLLTLAGGALTGEALAGDEDVGLTTVETVVPDPGGFATITCRIDTPAIDREVPGDMLLVLQAPRGWKALSPVRQVTLEPGTTQTIPFSVWVPPLASSDSLHTARFTLRSLSDSTVHAIALRGLKVKPAYGVTLSASTTELRSRAGEEARLTVTVRNTGNRRDTIRLRTESTPEWRVILEAWEIVLAPGEARSLPVILEVPETALAETMHLLGVQAVSEGAEEAGLEEPVEARVQVRTTALARRRSESRFARLPVEAAISAGEAAPGEPSLGFRASSSGLLQPGTSAEFEADLATRARSRGEDGWRNQVLRASVTHAAWTASAGDVSGRFSDLAAQTLSGRGIGVSGKIAPWAVRFLGVRSRASAQVQSWGGGVTRTLGERHEIGGDILYRTETAGNGGLRTDRLACLNGTWDAPHDLKLGGELAFSRTGLEGRTNAGRAIQLLADHPGGALQFRGRLYAGSRGFGGRTRDRDGVLFYSAYVVPSQPIRIWSHFESTRSLPFTETPSPLATATRYRIGTRWERHAWPAVELSFGGQRDRSALDDSVQVGGRRDGGVTASWARGAFLAAATVRLGKAWNEITGESGATGGTEVSAGGRAGAWRLALHGSRDRDWAPESAATQRTQAVSADLAWSSRAERFHAGFGISSRHLRIDRALESEVSECRLQPRADYRIGPHLRLHADASLFGSRDRTTLDRWQVSLRYSSDDLLPVPWTQVRGGIRGVAFIDNDGDGRPGPAEPRVAGVLLRADGRHLVTDQEGNFEWPALEPGTYWVDLDRSTIPEGLVAALDLPAEVQVEAGSDEPFYIPFSPCGDIAGNVFLDEDQDGSQDERERGLPDLHVALWRNGLHVADGITDRGGRFRMHDLPAGPYELRIDPAWLPDGWVASGQEAETFAVEAGRSTNLTPYGVGPRLKPIIITYPGAHPRENQDTAPRLRTGGTSPDPSAPPERPPGSK